MKINIEVDVTELPTNPKGEDQRFRIQVKAGGQLFEREHKINAYNRTRWGLSSLVAETGELTRSALMHGGIGDVETHAVWDYRTNQRVA